MKTVCGRLSIVNGATMTTTGICDFCERWVATSWPQHQNRLKNMKSVPGAETNPCPHCGGTYWALKPPPGPQSPLEPTDWTTAMKVVGLTAAAILLAALFLLGMAYRAHAQATYRDSAGRLTGTASTSSNSVTTFRDASGRQTGTANTNSNGTTTFSRWLWPHDRHGGREAMSDYYPDTSNFDLYEFTPQQDITAYELAMIMRELVPSPPGMPLARKIYIAKKEEDRPVFLTAQIMRHFT
jgi:hypothetical protein